MLPVLGWGGGTGDVTQTSPRGRVPTHPFPFSIPFLSSPLTHHPPPPPPFFPQGGTNPTGHVSHCCFARPGARRARAVPPPRPTRNPPPAHPHPAARARCPGPAARPTLPSPALPCRGLLGAGAAELHFKGHLGTGASSTPLQRARRAWEKASEALPQLLASPPLAHQPAPLARCLPAADTHKPGQRGAGWRSCHGHPGFRAPPLGCGMG